MGSTRDHPDQGVPNQHIVDFEQLISQQIEDLPTITPKPCIYKISQILRDVNPIAYTPYRVAIGPYHADAQHLKSMEPLKLRYLVSLMSRSRGQSKLKDYTITIEKRASEALQYYSGIEDLGNQLGFQKFQRMLLLDGSFILELFCRWVEAVSDGSNGPPAELMSHMGSSVSRSSDASDSMTSSEMAEVIRDLILLENQLPFFILEDLFDCTFSGDNIPITVAELAYNCMNFLIPINNASQALSSQEVKELSTQEKVMHLVHLMRMFCLDIRGGNPTFPQTPHLSSFCMCLGRKKHHQLRYHISITELHKAGMRFKKGGKGHFIDIKFDETQGVVELPYLYMGDTTEIFFRNVIAFELYYLGQFHVTNYLCFMDGLIDTANDVHILEERHLIDNWLESKENIAAIFNKITEHTSIVYSLEYLQMFDKLTAYVMKPSNRWKAMLRQDYLGSPWAIISIVAAVVLLGLTAVQTIASVRSTNWH